MRKSCLILLLISVYSSSFSQINWTKHNGNPVIQADSNILQNVAVGQPTCLVENDTIKMWYAGVGGDLKGRIFHAWSTDGINWTKYNNGNPVMDVGASGEWDRGWLDTPEILKDGSGYKLYYYGDTAWQDPAYSSAIGLATSPDGINWSKHPNNPVLTKGNQGDWDGTFIESPALVFDSISEEYYMFYSGVDTVQWKAQIGLATSTDGVSWNKDTSNPVIANGAFFSYDDVYAAVPAVLHLNGEFKLWYSAASANSYNPVTENFDTLSICFASSNNGIDWIKHPANPLFNTFTPPYDSLTDSFGPWASDVVLKGNEYLIFYETMAGICMASSNIVNLEERFNTDKQDLTIYPNPASTNINIKYRLKESGSVSIELINTEGKKVEIIKTGHDAAGYHTINKNTIGLSKGFYFIRFISNKNVSIHPLVLN